MRYESFGVDEAEQQDERAASTVLNKLRALGALCGENELRALGASAVKMNSAPSAPLR